MVRRPKDDSTTNIIDTLRTIAAGSTAKFNAYVGARSNMTPLGPSKASSLIGKSYATALR
jgi:hypothetical protein